ncbi:DUF4391 domain-containing protein [Clostridioides difficile]
MGNIFELLELDKKVKYVGQKIPKKLFYQQSNLSKDDEKIFVEYIDKIEMSYVLDTSNINIDVFVNEEYNYSAVGYMRVNLKQNDKVNRISKIINNSIPNPLVVIFEYDGKIFINTAIKRINKSDKIKVVVEDSHTTPCIDLVDIDDTSKKFLDSIKLSSLTYNNFYEFYKMIDDRIYTIQNVDIVGEYKATDNKDEIEDTKAIIEKINIYNEELKKIINKIKKESQFNKKMKLNVEATKVKEEIQRLQSILSK